MYSRFTSSDFRCNFWHYRSGSLDATWQIAAPTHISAIFGREIHSWGRCTAWGLVLPLWLFLCSSLSWFTLSGTMTSCVSDGPSSYAYCSRAWKARRRARLRAFWKGYRCAAGPPGLSDGDAFSNHTNSVGYWTSLSCEVKLDQPLLSDPYSIRRCDRFKIQRVEVQIPCHSVLALCDSQRLRITPDIDTFYNMAQQAKLRIPPFSDGYSLRLQDRFAIHRRTTEDAYRSALVIPLALKDADVGLTMSGALLDLVYDAACRLKEPFSLDQLEVATLEEGRRDWVAGPIRRTTIEEAIVMWCDMGAFAAAGRSRYVVTTRLAGSDAQQNQRIEGIG